MTVHIEKVERLGNYMTLQEAAKVHNSTPNAIYQWMKSHDKHAIQIGHTLLVHEYDLASYKSHVNKRERRGPCRTV